MNTVSVLVVSCDAYADAWRPFFQNFYEYWPDCPYPIYLQTNHLRPVFPAVNVVAVGKDCDWSSNLKVAVSQIKTEKILILLEDFWLWQPVKTEVIDQLASCLEGMKAGYLRLVPKPPPDALIPGRSDVGQIYKGSNYRVSFQAGLWSKKVLLKILLSGESAWEAEMAGSKRSHQLNCHFLSVAEMPESQWPIRYLNAIIKRKWTPEAVFIAKQRQLSIDFQKRDICNWYDQLRRKKTFSRLVNVFAVMLNKILGKKLYGKIKNLSWIRRLIY